MARTSAVAVALWLVIAAPAAADAPANDAFVDAAAIAGAPVEVDGSNVGATREPDEPLDDELDSSVWYAWTAPATKRYRIDTCGSDFHAYVKVFSGTQLAALEPVPVHDVWCDTVSEGVRFEVTAGTTYRIAVAAYGWFEGTFHLAISEVSAPANDSFADAESLIGSFVDMTGSTVAGTVEPGEPAPEGASASVWYRWTAPETGRYRVSACGTAQDDVVRVYTGAQVGALTPTGTPYGCMLSFDAASGTAYSIAVTGMQGGEGPFTLRLRRQPANDEFASAQKLTGAPLTVDGTTVDAGTEPNQPSAVGAASVWYEWTVPADGTYRFDTCRSEAAAAPAVYSGDALGSLTAITPFTHPWQAGICDVGGGGWAVVRLTAGQVLRIAVSMRESWLTPGAFTLSIARESDPPVGEVETPPSGSDQPVRQVETPPSGYAVCRARRPKRSIHCRVSHSQASDGLVVARLRRGKTGLGRWSASLDRGAATVILRQRRLRRGRHVVAFVMYVPGEAPLRLSARLTVR